MPNINDLKKSSFLKKEDCGDGILVTIRKYEEMNIAKDGAPAEYKWALHFDEVEKPLILNSTNGQIIERIAGSGEFDDWIGHKIVLYNDPNVSYAGKMIGGVRCRAPKGRAAAAAQTVQKPAPKPTPPADILDQDVPF